MAERAQNPCTGCPLSGTSKSSTHGSNKARFLIVGKQPSVETVRDGGNLTSNQMKLISKMAKQLGFSRKEFLFTNSPRCSFDPTRHSTADKKSINQHCREYLLRVIDRAEPEVIIPLGAEAAKSVIGRPVKITKAAGVPVKSEEHGCIVLPMLDPAMVHIKPQYEALFRSDFEALARAVGHEYDLQAIEDETRGDYSLVTDLQFLIDQNPKEIAVDVETMGFNYYDDTKKLLTIQLCTEPGVGYMVSWDHPDAPAGKRLKNKLRRQLKQLLQNPDIDNIGSNLKFDLSWIWSKVGFPFRIDHDVVMLAACHDENLDRKGLNILTKLFVPPMAGYDDIFNARYDKANMHLVPLNKLLPYAPGDVDATLQVYHTLRPLVEADPRLWQSYTKVSIPGLNAFAVMEKGGTLVDTEALDVFEGQLALYVEGLEQELLNQVHRSVLRDHAEKGLKFSRSAFVLDILFNHPNGFRLTPLVFTKTTENLDPQFRVPSTSSKDHLPFFFDECPFTEELANYVKLSRLLGTNVRRFRENYIHKGSVNPKYSLSTAVTGRSSSSDPNGQNYPNKGSMSKAYKRIFVAPKRHFIVAADLSQAELRIAADSANERTMIEVYNAGGDIHRTTAITVMGFTENTFAELDAAVRKDRRFKAKAINFGYIYGMWWRKFKMYAKTQYGIDLTDQEAMAWRDRYFELYPGLEPWHDSVKRFVHKHGYVRSYDGRIRHLPMIWSDDESVVKQAERAAINAPIQSFASQLGVMSIARMTQEVGQKYAKVNQFVHDAIYAYAPEQYVEWTAKTMKYYMESNPIEDWFGVKLKVPIIADPGFGLNGGDMYEMEGLVGDEPFEFSNILSDDEEFPFELPPQRIPPRRGRIIVPDYLNTNMGLD